MATKKTKSQTADAEPSITIIEYKRRKEAGTLTSKNREEAAAAQAAFQKVADDFKSIDDEAEALLLATGSDKTIPELARYIERNPPSPAVIAFLVMKLRNHYEKGLNTPGGKQKGGKSTQRNRLDHIEYIRFAVEERLNKLMSTSNIATELMNSPHDMHRHNKHEVGRKQFISYINSIKADLIEKKKKSAG